MLKELMEKGWIYLDEKHQEYVGIASDGIHVGIGNKGDEERIEHYLADNPTPDKW